MNQNQSLIANLPNLSISLKRPFDICASFMAILVLMPIYAIIAITILAFDGYPIFFRQDRPGLNARPFKILKFRTMKNSNLHLDDQDRLTPIGKFLRSFSLDELPEFWNVLCGDMSLVGPRPLLVSYLSRYSPQQARRHDVRPGVTGWAQINGRNSLTWERRFEMDVWYVENASLMLDLKILVLTVFRVFKRDGISAKGMATMYEFTGDLRAPPKFEEPLKDEQSKIEMSSADIVEADIQAVINVLRSGRLALGPQTIEFEKKIARFVGVKHAIAVSSGTAALHLIVKALGIGPGDEVLVPSFTFAASVNAILYVGATPIFVDLREDTYNLDANDLQRKLTPKTKAIMAVDVFGHPVEWDEILTFAQANNLKVIDDCCEALGAEYKGKRAGSFGDAGAFAFYPNKQITTGEGGMIVTNDDEIAKLARSYRNQGRDEMGQWLEHPRLGYNYRLDEMSAALGSSQMNRIEAIVEKRAHVAERYTAKLSAVPGIRVPQVLAHVKMSWFVYVIALDKATSADDVIAGLARYDIPSRAYFSPIHAQPYIAGENPPSMKLNLPHTYNVAGTTIALPFHNKMSDADLDRVVFALNAVLAELKIEYKKAL